MLSSLVYTCLRSRAPDCVADQVETLNPAALIHLDGDYINPPVLIGQATFLVATQATTPKVKGMNGLPDKAS
jgi:hypothetical protein